MSDSERYVRVVHPGLSESALRHAQVQRYVQSRVTIVDPMRESASNSQGVASFIGDALRQFASTRDPDSFEAAFAGAIADALTDIASRLEDAANDPAIDNALRYQAGIWDIFVDGPVPTLEDYNRAIEQWNWLVEMFNFYIALAQALLGSLAGTCNATARALCENFWKPECEPPMVPDPPCEYVSDTWDPGGPPPGGGGGGGGAGIAGTRPGGALDAEATDEAPDDGDEDDSGAEKGGAGDSSKGNQDGKAQEPSAGHSVAAADDEAGIEISPEGNVPALRVGESVKTAPGAGTTGIARTLTPSGGVGAPPGAAATSEGSVPALSVCGYYVPLAKRLLQSAYSMRGMNPPASLQDPKSTTWEVADATMLEEFKKNFARDGGLFGTGGPCVQLVVVDGTGQQQKRATASPAEGGPTVGTATGPTAGPAAAPSSSDGGSASRPAPSGSAASRASPQPAVSPEAPNPCQHYWTIARHVLASVYAGSDSTMAEPALDRGTLVCTVADETMRQEFDRAFRSDPLVRGNLASATACVRVVQAPQTVPSAAGSAAPAGSAAGSGSVGPSGSAPIAAASTSTALCLCGCALARLNEEGQAKSPEEVERQIDYLWNAAHNTFRGGRRLTAGLDRSSTDRKGLAIALVEKCRSAASAGAGVGDTPLSLGPRGLRSKAIQIANIEELKHYALWRAWVTIWELNKLREKAGSLVATLAEYRVEYAALLNDPNADPKRKEELRLYLAMESVVELDALVYVVGRLDLEIANLETLMRWISSLGSDAPLLEAEARFEFYSMLMDFADAAHDDAALLIRGLNELTAARLTVARQEDTIFWPVSTAEWALPSEDKPAFSAPSGTFRGESPIVTDVRKLFEAFRDAPRPGSYYASNTVAAKQQGREDLERYKADVATRTAEFDKASSAEWSRLTGGFRATVANASEIIGIYTLGVSLVRGVASLPRLLKLLPGLVKNAAQSAARGLRTIASNPRAFMKGGYRALVEALERGYRLGVDVDEAGRVGRTASAAAPPAGAAGTRVTTTSSIPSAPRPGAGGRPTIAGREVTARPRPSTPGPNGVEPQGARSTVGEVERVSTTAPSKKPALQTTDGQTGTRSAGPATAEQQGVRPASSTPEAGGPGSGDGGGPIRPRDSTPTVEGPGAGGGLRSKGSQGPIRKAEVTTYEDFVDRSVVGDNLEGHEVWQHANQKAHGLAGRRLGTEASKGNPVIALEHETHMRVNAAQRAIDASSQSPIDNIRANVDILRKLEVASPQVLDGLEKMAVEHARSLGH